LLSNFAYTALDRLTGPLLGSHRRCHDDALYPALQVAEVGPVIEKYKLPPIEIFDKNCPLKRVNQKFAIFRQNVRKLELFW